MAAFTARDPVGPGGFQAFWDRILSEPKIVIRTILFQREVAGSILSYENGRRRELSYWLGKRFWVGASLPRLFCNI